MSTPFTGVGTGGSATRFQRLLDSLHDAQDVLQAMMKRQETSFDPGSLRTVRELLTHFQESGNPRPTCRDGTPRGVARSVDARLVRALYPTWRRHFLQEGFDIEHLKAIFTDSIISSLGLGLEYPSSEQLSYAQRFCGWSIGMLNQHIVQGRVDST